MEYGNNILVPFNMIYDTDIGLFKSLKDYCKNPKYINKHMLDITNNNFRHIMINAENYDPLSEFMNPDYKISSMHLYNEILDIPDNYDKMIKLSEPTDVLGLVAVFLKSSLVKVTVLCRDIGESFIIKNNKLLEGVSITIQTDNGKIDTSKFDSIFIKKYTEILQFNGIQGKSLFVANYRFNKDVESTEEKIIPLKDVSMLVGDTNRIYFIDLYKIDDSYPIYG